jgi:hypothetical protein
MRKLGAKTKPDGRLIAGLLLARAKAPKENLQPGNALARDNQVAKNRREARTEAS